MSFLTNEPQTFINIKLTDSGRRQLSLGQLVFTKAVFSDREVDYSVGRTASFNINRSRVISPKDDSPAFTINYDGSNAIELVGNQVTSARQLATATTLTAGFFSGDSNAFSYRTGDTSIVGQTTITYSGSSLSGGYTLNVDSGSYTAKTGDLIFIPWETLHNSGKTYTAESTVLSGNPGVSLWYRVSGVTVGGSGVVGLLLDRPIPNMSAGTATTIKKINSYYYPYNGIENYYGSASTISTNVWNMNIVRTNTVEGALNTGSGFTCYGSIEYAGAKHYLGFSSDTKALGILHFTNEWSGNTYAEQFVEKTFKLSLPTIMWHNVSDDTGTAKSYGLIAYDQYGDTLFDVSANTTFRYLRDGIGSTSKVIGRVYHKLRMAVISDPELLAAMTYKSNRNYTLPEPILTLTSNPKFPLNTSQATGLCSSGYTYFVSYIPETHNRYISGASFGYQPVLHCENISVIEGQEDVNGNAQFLSVSFPSKCFPYLRSSANMIPTSSYSGTGWNANSIQILVNRQLTSAGYNKGNVPASDWIRISDKNATGNGIYSANTAAGDLTIDPLKIAGYNFVMSLEDYSSGTTYYLNSHITGGTNGLYFGSESFVFGNVDVDILATTYKTSIVAYAKNDILNTTNNDTFDSELDDKTYITEIGILDQDNNLVAVGKPTYPMRKTIGRFLTFQLEIDF
jgi:hypothetical protein